MSERVAFTPKARIGDDVDVLNYRSRPAQWERGTVKAVEFNERWSRGFTDSYEVGIARPVIERPYGRNRGGGYTITVGRDAIRKVSNG